MAVQPTRVCIVSRDPLRSGRFIAALEASVGPGDHLEIIVDRRHGGSSGETDLKEDRRRQRQVAFARPGVRRPDIRRPDSGQDLVLSASFRSADRARPSG